jgi:hypothetical protein
MILTEGVTMAKAGRKTEEMRHVSFRMLQAVYDDYVMVAEARGVDLSSVLNWVLVEFLPVLLLRHAEHVAGMLRAATAGPGTADDAEAADAAARVNDLIRQLQELTALVRRRAGGGDRRRAA